jgi:glycosyltransferase involved in cell wall biosynthesis
MVSTPSATETSQPPQPVNMTVSSIKNILLYYPPNNRSIAIETICKTVIESGHRIFVLTLSEPGALHEVLENLGITAVGFYQPRKPSWKFYLAHARYLVHFCRQNKIDVIWSHFPEANVIAMIAQRFVRARVFVFRHHDESAFYAQYGNRFGMVRNPSEIRIDKIINRFARRIVVLSEHVKHTMITYEKCKPGKIIVCPLIYNFSMYPKPEPERTRQIREQFPCRLLLIMVSRMIESKQHLPVFEIMKQLVDEGLSVKMIVMDEGPLRPRLEQFIQDNKLENHIVMPGYSTELMNYMGAADMLMHPSLTEASSNVVKEMGNLEKAVAVCEGVGDFDDYIKAGINGFVMSRSNLKPTIEQAIREAYAHPERLTGMGKNLKREVIALFSDSAANRARYLQLT